MIKQQACTNMTCTHNIFKNGFLFPKTKTFLNIFQEYDKNAEFSVVMIFNKYILYKLLLLLKILYVNYLAIYLSINFWCMNL